MGPLAQVNKCPRVRFKINAQGVVNLTVTVANSFLSKYLTVILLFMQFGQLPPTMYLQMDNCWRENKNLYVFCFLALLVELGIFEKVVIIIRCVFT